MTVGLLALALTLWSQGAQSAKPEDRAYRFGVDVDMVSFSITVLDEKKRLVTDLEPSSFEIYEDGVAQSIAAFAREEVPLRMMILLDTSSSMQSKLALAQEAAVNFVGSLKKDDEVQVVSFSDRVLTLSPMSSDFDTATEAIRSTEAEGATSLYNAIYVSLRELLEPRGTFARQAIVVLSDGADTKSLVAYDDVLSLARRADVTIYAIALRATERDLVKDKYREARYALGKLADETGGVTFTPESSRELSGIYERIATELRSQYSVAYVPTNTKTDGSWRRLQVHCEKPGTQVRTRVGYFARRARSRPAAPQPDP